jgi:hypothetical protein
MGRMPSKAVIVAAGAACPVSVVRSAGAGTLDDPDNVAVAFRLDPGSGAAGST